MPGSSSTVTVSSSTSGASGIVASETWLPGLCSWASEGQVSVGGPSVHPTLECRCSCWRGCQECLHPRPWNPPTLRSVSAPAGENGSMSLPLNTEALKLPY